VNLLDIVTQLCEFVGHCNTAVWICWTL